MKKLNMAWGDQFNKQFYLAAARDAYDALGYDEKLTIDAAIIKRLSRDAYEASLRIYDIRGLKKNAGLVQIFDKIIHDYTEPDRITMLRGYFAEFENVKKSETRTQLAEEELADVGDYYQTVMLTAQRARQLAVGGIKPETFASIRSQLLPMAPVVSYVLRAFKVEFVNSMMVEN